MTDREFVDNVTFDVEQMTDQAEVHDAEQAVETDAHENKLSLASMRADDDLTATVHSGQTIAIDDPALDTLSLALDGDTLIIRGTDGTEWTLHSFAGAEDLLIALPGQAVVTGDAVVAHLNSKLAEIEPTADAGHHSGGGASFGVFSISDLGDGLAITGGIGEVSSLFGAPATATSLTDPMDETMLVDSREVGIFRPTGPSTGTSTGVSPAQNPLELGSDVGITVFQNSSEADRINEPFNVAQAVESFGYDASFTSSTDEAAMREFLADKEALIFTELENYNFDGPGVAEITAGIGAAVNDFVSDGGSLVVMGSHFGEAIQFINGVFDLGLVDLGWERDYVSTLNTDGAAGTLFEDNPTELPWTNGTFNLIDVNSLPEGSQVIYHGPDETGASVVTISFGAGQITYVAFDGFDAAPFGVQDDGWLETLQDALSTGDQTPNRAPTLTGGNATGSEDDASVTVDLASLGADPDSDNDGSNLSYQIIGAPAAGVASVSGSTLTFAPGADFQGLADGESQTVTVTLQASDRHGVVSNTANVTIEVTGANDAVVVTAADLNGAITEDANLTDSGTISFTDVDLTDAHTVSVALKSTTHDGELGTMSAAVTADTTGTGTGGEVTWNFSATDDAIGFLNSGESVTQIYTVTLTDNEGSTVTQDVTVVINGADEPADNGDDGQDGGSPDDGQDDGNPDDGQDGGDNPDAPLVFAPAQTQLAAGSDIGITSFANFTNPSDTNEPYVVSQIVDGFGYNTSFTATLSDAEMRAFLADKEALIFSETEGFRLPDAPTVADVAANVGDAIADYVQNGGTFVIMGDVLGEAVNFMNATFGFNLSGADAPAGTTANLETANANGTLFADNSGTLPSVVGVEFMLDPSSLPEGAQVIYSGINDAGAAVVTMQFGSGQITYLAYDYFRAAPVGGTDAGDWNEVLKDALSTPEFVPGTPADGNDDGGSDAPVADNQAPVVLAGAASAVEDGDPIAVALSVLGSDADPEDDGSTLTYSIVGQPSEGSASIDGTTLSFDPGSDFQDLNDGETREVTVTIQATDSQGAVSNTADITITVNGVTDASDDTGGDTGGDDGSTGGDNPDAPLVFAPAQTQLAAGSDIGITSFANFTNPSDTNEPYVVSQIVDGFGYNTSFTATLSDAEMRAFLADKEALIFSETEGFRLPDAPTVADVAANVGDAIADYVQNGGTFVIMGDVLGEAVNFMNATFGFNLSGADAPAGTTANLETANANGTLFADNSGTLPSVVGVEFMLDPSSLPEGAQVIYSGINDAGAAVVTMQFGSGQITYLAYDYFRAAPVGGTDAGDWNEVLKDALSTPSFDGTPSDPVVADPNTAPVVIDGTATADEDGAAVEVALANLGSDVDADDDGSTLTYSIVGQPSEGSASIDGTTLSFDPGSDFQELNDGETRDVSVTIQATDSHGAVSNTATVTVTVNGADEPVVDTVQPDVEPAQTQLAAGSDVGLTLFANSTFAAPENEPYVVDQLVQGMGYNTSFTNALTDSGMRDYLADKEALIFTKYEGFRFPDAPSIADIASGTGAAISDFVEGGGTFVVMGDPLGESVSLLNQVFGLSLVATNEASRATSTIDADNAANTLFADNTGTLPGPSGVEFMIDPASLPGNAEIIYSAGDQGASVVTFTIGEGQVTYLAFDWFRAAPVGGTEVGDWNEVLQDALSTGSNFGAASLSAQSIEFGEDSLISDDAGFGEMAAHDGEPSGYANAGIETIQLDTVLDAQVLDGDVTGGDPEVTFVENTVQDDDGTSAIEAWEAANTSTVTVMESQDIASQTSGHEGQVAA